MVEFPFNMFHLCRLETRTDEVTDTGSGVRMRKEQRVERAREREKEGEATAKLEKEQHMEENPPGHSFNYLSDPWCRDHSPTNAHTLTPHPATQSHQGVNTMNEK